MTVAAEVAAEGEANLQDVVMEVVAAAVVVDRATSSPVVVAAVAVHREVRN